MSFIEKLIPIKSIQEHLRQLLQTVRSHPVELYKYMFSFLNILTKAHSNRLGGNIGSMDYMDV